MTKPEKKFFIDKQEDLDSVVDKIIKAKVQKVIINVPRDSILGSSINNFAILKREAATAGKEIAVESVDDHILELAAISRIKAANPVFRKRERPVFDIVPRAGLKKREAAVVVPKIEEEVAPKEEVGPEKIAEKEERIEKIKIEKEGKPKKRPYKWLIVILILGVLGTGVWFLGFKVLPKADIKIELKKSTVNFEENIVTRKNVTGVETGEEGMVLPGELLIANRNLQMNFPAHGKEEIKIKARGKLTVYNSYSSEPQVLVEATRFESSGGKIFKLDKRTVIPGAKIQNGKIVPSKIDVAVTAAEPGADYNVAAGGGWRIPGFKGSPKYEGFYAEAAEAFSGGFVGERLVPTADDITQAKTKIEEALKDAAQSQMLVLLTPRFKLLDEAVSFKIIKEEVNSKVDDNGNFSIFGEAEMRNMVFEEDVLKNALIEKNKGAVEGNLRVLDFNLGYGDVKADLLKGEMSFTAKGSTTFAPLIVVEDFRNQILRMDEARLKGTLLSLQGVDKAKISFWPFWVHRVPQNPKRVNISLE